MKHKKLRKILLSLSLLSLLPFADACSNNDSSDDSHRRAMPKFILEGTKDDTASESHNYLDYYTITSSEVAGVTGYAVALKDGADPVSITIPAAYGSGNDAVNIVGIMPYGFRDANATSITFEGEIQVIDYEAFLGSNIQSINIPWSIKKIGDSAFYDCQGLQTVRFNSTDQSSTGTATQCPCEGNACVVNTGTSTSDPKPCTLTNIPQFCFFNCRSLTTLTLPASIVEIEYEAFNGCSALSSTLFFQNLRTIRARAFQGCISLGKVYIPNSFFLNGGVIEALAFNHCDPDLKFNFSTDEEDTYEDWLEDNPDWGWYNETGITKLRYTPEFSDSADIVFDDGWQFKIEEFMSGENGATIISYEGEAPSTHHFLVCPNELGGQPVRRISSGAFAKVKSDLHRLYLPTTLYAIENEMFGPHPYKYTTDAQKKAQPNYYQNLSVIDSRDHCSLDWDSEHNTSVANPQKRIDLSHLVDLQFIGYWSFATMVKRKEIELLHLPANLIAIGSEAFCRFSGYGHMDGVKEFLWDFDESTSRLQVIGTDAFFKLGVAGSDNQTYGNGSYNSAIKPTTIVFPKTFKYFGLIQADIDEYKVRRESIGENETGKVLHIAFDFDKLDLSGKNDANFKWQRPAHCFVNCPLIGNIIFKGSMTPKETTDLIIPNQTFVYNENLQRIIFEERKDHYISFHTQEGGYAQQCIGSNGVGSSSFRGRPFLQTIVLPTKYTKLYIQKYAFQGNPRAVMYLSGSYGNDGSSTTKAGMYYDSNGDSDRKNSAWTNLNPAPSTNLDGDGGATQWRTIGDEKFSTAAYGNSDSKYLGYCFSSSEKTNMDSNPSKNRFHLDQKIPYYENVHFKMSFTVKAYVITNDVGSDQTTTVTAEVGEKSANSLEYVERNDCAYLCGGTDTIGETTVNKAIMANYLYRLWPNGDDQDLVNNRNLKTITVAKTVTDTVDNPSLTYTVTEIGASAFSAAHCNQALTDARTNKNNQGKTNDINVIKLPNTIKKIGEYAFMRAYALQEISAYDTNPNSAVKYNMPSNLEYVGRNAFSFCNVAQFLNIPDNCLFYENDNLNNQTADYETTSVFTNNFALRKITFKHGNATSTESNKYVTSTYLEGTSVYTTALYSKDTPDNPSRLLIILNRNSGTHTYDGVANVKYYDTPSKSDSLVQDFVKIKNSDTLPTFKVPSPYAAKPFLYGAYKMALWVKQAHIGYCTTTTGNVASSRAEIQYQPLFSGITTRNTAEGAADQYGNKILLGSPAADYATSIVKDLRKASGEMFDMPLYGFNGCANLNEIHLPYNDGGTLPEGLFANVTSENLKYSTDDATGENGFLDLSGTDYAGIGKETFMSNSSIKKVKAPAVSSFTIGSNAFDGCTNLAELDLSAVTGSVTIKSGAFNGCSNLTTLSLKGVTGSVTFETGCFKGTKINSITWPDDTTATISIGISAFENDASLTSLTLPAKTLSLGKDCFKGCTSLATVAFAGSNTDITTIGEGSFYNCSALNSFDFTNLTNLTTIGKSSFNSAGTIVPNGTITFGDKITTFGETAFSGSGLVSVTFTCSSITLNSGAFSSINTLQKVRFTNHACLWNGGASAFSGCGALTDLQLPTGFNLNTSGSVGMILNDTNTDFHLYCYHKFNEQSPSTNWRKINATTGAMEEPCYYVGELSDVSKAANLSTGVISYSAVEFWTLYNGEAKYLGTITSASTSLVKFSEGWQMDDNGNVSQTPAP